MQGIRVKFQSKLIKDKDLKLNLSQEQTLSNILAMMKAELIIDQLQFQLICKVGTQVIQQEQLLKSIAAKYSKNNQLVIIIEEKKDVSKFNLASAIRRQEKIEQINRSRINNKMSQMRPSETNLSQMSRMNSNQMNVPYMSNISKIKLKVDYIMRGNMFKEPVTKSDFSTAIISEILMKNLKQAGLNQNIKYLKVFYQGREIEKNKNLLSQYTDGKKPIDFQIRIVLIKINILVNQRVIEKEFGARDIFGNCMKAHLNQYFCYLMQDEERFIQEQEYRNTLDTFTEDGNILIKLKFKEINIKTNYKNKQFKKKFKAISTQKIKQIYSEKQLKQYKLTVGKENKLVDLEKQVGYYAQKQDLVIMFQQKVRILQTKQIIAQAPIPVKSQTPQKQQNKNSESQQNIVDKKQKNSENVENLAALPPSPILPPLPVVSPPPASPQPNIKMGGIVIQKNNTIVFSKRIQFNKKIEQKQKQSLIIEQKKNKSEIIAQKLMDKKVQPQIIPKQKKIQLEIVSEQKINQSVIQKQDLSQNKQKQIQIQVIEKPIKQYKYGQQIQEMDILIEDLPNLQENVTEIIESYPQTDALQLIIESYQRCVEKLDSQESKKTQSKLKTYNNNYQFRQHPLIVLGESLKNKKKTVFYLDKPNPASYYTYLHLTSMFGSNYQGFKCKFSEISNKTAYTYDSIIKSEDQLNSFTSTFKQSMSKKFKSSVDSIILNSINEDLTVNFYTVIDVDVSLKGESKDFGDFTLETYNLFETLALDIQFLNKQSTNFVDDDKIKPQQHKRGGYPYYQPAGWIRYGLNVQKFTQQDGNDDWLGMNNNINEWAVMYHGLQDEKNASQIIKQNFKLGQNRLYELQAPIISNWTKKILKRKQITQQEYLNQKEYTIVDPNNNKKSHVIRKNTVGKGVYGTPLITVCEKLCKQFAILGDEPGRRYIVAFQCRVRPEFIYVSSKDPRYWIVRESKYIRPYGLLVSEQRILRREQHKLLNQQFEKKYLELVKNQQCIIF